MDINLATVEVTSKNMREVCEHILDLCKHHQLSPILRWINPQAKEDFYAFFRRADKPFDALTPKWQFHLLTNLPVRLKDEVSETWLNITDSNRDYFFSMASTNPYDFKSILKFSRKHFNAFTEQQQYALLASPHEDIRKAAIYSINVTDANRDQVFEAAKITGHIPTTLASLMKQGSLNNDQMSELLHTHSDDFQVIGEVLKHIKPTAENTPQLLKIILNPFTTSCGDHEYKEEFLKRADLPREFKDQNRMLDAIANGETSKEYLNYALANIKVTAKNKETILQGLMRITQTHGLKAIDPFTKRTDNPLDPFSKRDLLSLFQNKASIPTPAGNPKPIEATL